MFRNLTPVVRTLLLVNIAAYVAQQLLGQVVELHFALFPLHADERFGAPPFQIWQLVTYAFLHGSVPHLFFNMFALYMFGPDLERLMGGRHFTLYYFVSVVGAALVQLTVLELFARTDTPTVGASGGIFGLLLAFGMAWPHRRLMLLFPPIPMPAWVFVSLYGVAELLMGIFGTMQGVAHFAHLGGMLGGYLLIRYWRYQARNVRGE
jgi:membrane associated rhomboid family serine protease